MRDLLSHHLTTITPFSKPDRYPVIRYGKGGRAIRFLCSPPNSKGMIVVETVPDLADKNVPIRLTVKQSLPIVGWSDLS